MPSLLLLAISLPGAAAPPAELAFAPEEGARLVERFEHRWKVELVDQEVVVTFDGEEVEQAVPDAQLRLDSEEVVVFETVYAGVEDGRAARVRRTYDTLSSRTTRSLVDAEGGEQDSREEGASELEGTTVVFTWDQDEEAYARSFEEDDDDADPALLEDLEAEHVLAVFLPRHEVEEGDEWDVELDAFRSISSPGGDLAIVQESDREDADEFREAFYDGLEGTITARHAGLREGLVVLELALELETRTEHESEFEGEGGEGTAVETLEFAFALEGELLWDVEAGHARALELAGDMELAVEERRSVETEDGDLEIVSTQGFEGEVEYRAEVE